MDGLWRMTRQGCSGSGFCGFRVLLFKNSIRFRILGF